MSQIAYLDILTAPIKPSRNAAMQGTGRCRQCGNAVALVRKTLTIVEAVPGNASDVLYHERKRRIARQVLSYTCKRCKRTAVIGG